MESSLKWKVKSVGWHWQSIPIENVGAEVFTRRGLLKSHPTFDLEIETFTSYLI